MTDDKFRVVRAALRNAVMWGAACAVAGGAIVGGLTLIDPGLGVGSLLERIGVAIVSGGMWGVRFGVAGAVIGATFTSVIRLAYRGRRLADINPAGFAIVGGVVGGLAVPLYLQAMNVLSGGPIAWRLVSTDAVWASLFGAAAAGGSILLARRAGALPRGAGAAELERSDDLDGLPAADDLTTVDALPVADELPAAHKVHAERPAGLHEPSI